MYQHNLFNGSKISSEFAHRLSCLQPQQKVRVVVMLKFDNGAFNAVTRRQSPSERVAKVEGIRTGAKQALSYIRKIIQDFGGKQLAEAPNALGTIPVEISAAGVKALAQSDVVKAVMEDQQIHPGDGFDTYY